MTGLVDAAKIIIKDECLSLFFIQLLVSDTSSDEEIWNTSVWNPKRHKCDPMDELKSFVSHVKKGLIQEELLITREKSFVSQVIAKYKDPTFDIGATYRSHILISHGIGCSTWNGQPFK